MTGFVFATCPRIVCEQGSSAQLGSHAKALGASHVFIVTDGFLHNSGLTTRMLESMDAAQLSYTLYTDVVADPPETSVEAAIAAAQAAGADCIIGFGGGSSMDTAKLVALLVKTPQNISDIYGINLAKGPRLPLIQSADYRWHWFRSHCHLHFDHTQ